MDHPFRGYRKRDLGKRRVTIAKRRERDRFERFVAGFWRKGQMGGQIGRVLSLNLANLGVFRKD